MRQPVLQDTVVEVTAVTGPQQRVQLRLASGGSLTAEAVVYAASGGEAARPHWWQEAAHTATQDSPVGAAESLQLASDCRLPDLDLTGTGRFFSYKSGFKPVPWKNRCGNRAPGY